jgi:hypothetical protein
VKSLDISIEIGCKNLNQFGSEPALQGCCGRAIVAYAANDLPGRGFKDDRNTASLSSAARYSGRYGSAGLTSSKVTGEHGKAERDVGPLEFRQASMLSTNLNGPESLHWN